MKARFFLCASGIALLSTLLAPTVKAIPLAGNTTLNPNNLVVHHIEDSVDFRVGTTSVTLSNLSDINDAVDNRCLDFSSIPGTNIPVSRGPDLTGTSGECTQDFVDNPPHDYTILFCPPSFFEDVFGVGISVLGLTQTEVDETGAIIEAHAYIRDGLTTGDAGMTNGAIHHVSDHECGHAFGLDHEPTSANNVMEPLVLVPTSDKGPSDIFSYQQIYASDPGNISSFGSDITCHHGTVVNQDNLPVSGVIVVGENENNLSAPEPLATMTGVGFDEDGNPNDPGDYTLCTNASGGNIITHISARKCDLLLPALIGNTLDCFGELVSAGEAITQGIGSLTIAGSMLAPYDEDGRAWAYSSGGSIELDTESGEGAIDVGDNVAGSAGSRQTGLDFQIEATFIQYPNQFLSSTPYFIDGGCQAISGSGNTSFDLGILLVLMFPLLLWASRKTAIHQKVRINNRETNRFRKGSRRRSNF